MWPCTRASISSLYQPFMKMPSLPLGGKRPPVAPRARPRGFLGRARAEGGHPDVPRVHPLGQLVGGLAAPAGLDARNEHQHRATLALRQVELRVEQGLAQLRFLARVDALREDSTLLVPRSASQPLVDRLRSLRPCRADGRQADERALVRVMATMSDGAGGVENRFDHCEG